MSGYRFSIAQPDDDAQLRARMAADWIEGAVALSLRREPSYFAASRLQGAMQTIVCREAATDAIVATLARSVATVLLDGVPQRAALVSDLRVDRAHRGRGLVARLFGELRALHEAEPLPCYTLVYEDNEAALRSLASGRPGMPRLRRFSRLQTHALHLGARRRPPASTQAAIRRARPDELPEIVRFLATQRTGGAWAPVIGVDDFEPGGRCDTLRAEDFFLALGDDGRIRATIAAWDQAPLRQAHVERYARPIAWARPAYNAVAALRGRPLLPAPQGRLPYVYLAFIAAEHDDAALCATLLEHVRRALGGERWLHALAALDEHDPLQRAFGGYRAMRSAVLCFEILFDAERAPAPPAGRPRVEFALT
ncbi:hypothetical protein [Trinickia sp. Y13]|uniref:hypothetical protein n=1 Tax=Trinickia sp. Y13 TaxID=2917807 RepID=UPI0024054C0A|nr:hypothetical protein [Trinickia sp. Y13]MDG0025480.1 hypothetical protein [Trinickia sp. Y13]